MKPIVNTTYPTRDGRSVRVIDTKRNHPEYKIVAEFDDGGLEIYIHNGYSNVCYSLKGRQRGEDIILCPLIAS